MTARSGMAAAWLATLALASAGCTGNIVSSGDDHGSGAGSEPPVGRLGFALQISEDVAVYEVFYTITRSGGYQRTGSIPLVGEDNRANAYFLLPAANNYTLRLDAPATNSTTCVGTVRFDISASAETRIDVPISCPGVRNLGGLRINGIFNVCPTAESIVAIPDRVEVGSTITLRGSGSDPDAVPQPLAYAWTATSGLLSAPSASSTTLHCTVPGSVTVGLTVSDGDPGCLPGHGPSVALTCLPQGGGIAGSSAAGTGGAGAGAAGTSGGAGSAGSMDGGVAGSGAAGAAGTTAGSDADEDAGT